MPLRLSADDGNATRLPRPHTCLSTGIVVALSSAVSSPLAALSSIYMFAPFCILYARRAGNISTGNEEQPNLLVCSSHKASVLLQ